MSLNKGEVNPLSVLGVRKLSFIPEHFTRVATDGFIETRLLDQWINYNLNSRYAIKKNVIVDQNNKMVETVEVGIEDPAEVTMLLLGCPYLHKK